MADLQVASGNHRLTVDAVPLGSPNKTLRRVLGGLIGVPIGLGIVVPPHALILGLGVAVYGLYVVGATALAMRAHRRFALDNNEALLALGRGELAEAHAVFARWAPYWHAMISGLARHNLGWTLMLEGRIEDAARILEDVAAHYPGALIRTSVLPTTRLDAGLCHALLGNLELAEAWYAKAAEPIKAPPQPKFPG